MSSHPEPLTTGWISQTEHYENFPIASLLVPAALRPAVAAVYRFARYADDVADEGDRTVSDRVAELDRVESALNGFSVHPIVEPLRPHLQARRFDAQHLRDLLSAFRQDAHGTDFPDRAALLDYCRRSANPVGRIVLQIFNANAQAAHAGSDAICTALQLINFIQDAGQDTERKRCYVPADELAEAGLSQPDLLACAAQQRIEPRVRALLDQQIGYALSSLRQGSSLFPLVPWRLRFEVAAIIAGGRLTAARTHAGDPFATRIKLGRADAPALFTRWLKIIATHRID